MTASRAVLFMKGGDPLWASVKGLWHFFDTAGSTTYVDSSASPANMTNQGGGTQTVTGGPYGNWLEITSARASTAADAKFAIGTDPFVWEFLYRTPATLATKNIADYGGSLGAGVYPVIYNLSTGELYYYSGATNRISAPAGTLVANTTYAICYQRNASNEGRMYVDGASVGTWTDATNYTGFSPVIVAAASGAPATGNWGEYRITIGASRYGTSYTPATAAFPNY